MIAGSVVALILAGLLGGALGSIAKAACRAGAWNVGVEQYQAHCYTDIYPLYYIEGLADGRVPYFDHHVEYPVVMGGVMQAAAWVVHSTADPGTRGREFYDVTVALLCAAWSAACSRPRTAPAGNAGGPGCLSRWHPR